MEKICAVFGCETKVSKEYLMEGWNRSGQKLILPL